MVAFGAAKYRFGEVGCRGGEVRPGKVLVKCIYVQQWQGIVRSSGGFVWLGTVVAWYGLVRCSPAMVRLGEVKCSNGEVQRCGGKTLFSYRDG